MFLKKFMLFCFLAFNIMMNAQAEDCASIFEHTKYDSTGKSKTFVADEVAYYSYESCLYKESAMEKLTPAGAKVLNYKIKARNFTKKRYAKLRAALIKLKRAINSSEFKRRVLAHNFNNRKSYANNQGLTNLAIYNKIMRGAESLISRVDYEMDLDVTLYYQDTSVIGYTYPNTTRIWVNSKYFDQFNHASIAGNITHEWLHKIGFGHDFEATARRPYSVPYAVGSILRSLIR